MPQIVQTLPETEKEFMLLLQKEEQPHLLSHYQSLSSEEKKIFRANVAPYCYRRSHIPLISFKEAITELLPSDLVTCLTEKERAACWDIGLEHIALQKIALVVFAGGSGTRFGENAVKSLIRFGLPSNKTIIQFQLEKLAAITAKAKKKFGMEVKTPHCLIIYAEKKKEQFIDEFREKNNFGLDQDRIHFICQEQVPSYDENGKILLKTRLEPLLTQNGNGTLYSLLHKHGMLELFKAEGVTQIQLLNGDNPLAIPCDPVMLGHAITNNLDLCVKCVEKTDLAEESGVFGLKDGKLALLEYCEIKPEDANLRKEDGTLAFGCANTGIYLASIGYLCKIASGVTSGSFIFPNHLSLKKERYFDIQSGELVMPEKPFVVKHEKHIVEFSGLAERPNILMASRMEFCPIKTPSLLLKTTECLHQMFHAWLKEAGAELVGAEDCTGMCEISPSTSVAGEDLEELVTGKTLCCPVVL